MPLTPFRQFSQNRIKRITPKFHLSNNNHIKAPVLKNSSFHPIRRTLTTQGNSLIRKIGGIARPLTPKPIV